MADGGLRITDWRKSRRLTVASLAARSGLSASYVSQLENGKRPYTETAVRALADALGCTQAQLFGEAPAQQPIEAVQPWVHPEEAAGHFLRAWRKHRGLTLAELAQMTDMTTGNLSRLERGEIPYSQRTWERLSAALGTDPASLILVSPAMADIRSLLAEFTPARRAQLAEIAQALAATQEGPQHLAAAGPPMSPKLRHKQVKRSAPTPGPNAVERAPPSRSTQAKLDKLREVMKLKEQNPPK